ncbi:unnamed protein product [Bursaphelenchus okinawaensis]|uniref:FHA domain-containing protein n=1 Tax=Bursaphelenchus okinawaensis TaxID=465554 RepID=A0A811KSI5_9BILA|nr:unnamed protein product [Bursaphelenchus okinawaensis]CAG9108544.1 unnamed protein product [Bursaphelenchus okinawaensis]
MSDKADSVFLAPKLPDRKCEKSEQKSSLNVNNGSPKPDASRKKIEYVDDFAPPSWAEMPPTSSDLSVELLSNGVLKDTVKLKDVAGRKSYVTIGRAEVCDIRVDVSEASRIHCYMQYGEAFDGRGWYVFDKGSTHGTYINKQELPKGVFFRAKPGSVLQIAKANYHLFITGTDEKIEREPAETKNIVQNPTKVLSNSKMYHSDPVNALKQFCEREGLDFEFQTSYGGKNEVTSGFELPDNVCGGDGSTFVAISESLQIAQKECALKVCTHLDTLGLLDGGINWSKKMNEGNDFYEDDEDTFYDRTGQIEAQRLKRIERHKAENGVTEKALNYDEIKARLVELRETEKAINHQLERLLKPISDIDLSSNEINVSSLNASLSIRMEVSKLKKKLEEARNEIKVMEKMKQVARPVKFQMFSKTTKNPDVERAIKCDSKSAPLEGNENKTESKDLELNVLEDVEQPGSFENSDCKLKCLEKFEEKTSMKFEHEECTSFVTVVKSDQSEEKKSQKQGSDGKTYGLLSRKELRKQDEITKNKRKVQEDENTFEEMDSKEKRNKTEKEIEKDEEPMWEPPKGQTGDGRTLLNDKLGY